MMLNGIKILIGDDSILARKQLKDIVSTYGTPVFLEASDTAQAVPAVSFFPLPVPHRIHRSAGVPLPVVRETYSATFLLLLSFYFYISL